MRERKGLIVLALIAWICACVSTENDARWEGVIDVVTEDVYTGEKICYSIDKNGRKREIEEVESDELTMLISGVSCFESYIGERDGKRGVFNRLGDGLLYDKEGLPVENSPEQKRILELASQFEHEICKIRIYETGGERFACVDLNVNWQWPFDLYYYDQEKDELTYVASFDSEEPIGLRLDGWFYRNP